MTWRAGLVGESPDLERMANTLGEGNPRVRVGADGGYVLESSTFDALEDAAGVKAEAERRLELMNGAMRAFDSKAGLVRLTGRFWDSDTPHLVSVPITAHAGATATLTAVAVATVDGHPIDPPPPPARGWVALAESNRNVAGVLRLTASGDLDWVGLYKVLEIVCGDVSGTITLTEAGKRMIIKRGWMTENQLDALTASANNEKVSGDAARHARTKGGIPSKIMTLDEGRYFVHRLVYSWLLEQRT
jgi:hypothetical protein